MNEFKKWFRRVDHSLGFHSIWQWARYEKQMEKAYKKGLKDGEFKARYKSMDSSR